MAYNGWHILSKIKERTVKRLAIVLTGLFFIALVTYAQDAQPVQTPEVTPILEVTVEVTPAVVGTPEVTPAVMPTATPIALSLEASEALPTLISARGDLELLANEVFGRDQRPAGWSGSTDATDPNLPLFVRLDLEVLAGYVLGAEVRPDGWFGVVPSSPLAIARDIRHDLELLADIVVGAPTIRPGLWTGDDPLMRCNRATQALVPLLERSGFVLNVDFSQRDYCRQIEIQTTRFVETQIIQPPAPAVTAVPSEGSTVGGVTAPYSVETPFVVTFYDSRARRRAGVLPVGTGFSTLSRSNIQFSNMMLITGDGFTLFVDYTTTPVTTAEFDALPEVELGAATDCSADWCE
jgi:hypothetical protein